jgi:hypothetical protein
MSIYGEQRYDAREHVPHTYALRTKGARTLFLEHAPRFGDAPTTALSPAPAPAGGVYVYLGGVTSGEPWTYVLAGTIRVLPIPVAVDSVTIIPAPASTGVVIVALSDSEHAPAVYSVL